jgi:hypothetical protein
VYTNTSIALSVAIQRALARVGELAGWRVPRVHKHFNCAERGELAYFAQLAIFGRIEAVGSLPPPIPLKMNALSTFLRALAGLNRFDLIGSVAPIRVGVFSAKNSAILRLFRRL